MTTDPNYPRLKRLLEGIGLEVPEETLDRYLKVLTGIAGHSRYNEDPISIIEGVFEEKGCQGIVVECNIPIYSYCEHHILPWTGLTHIGYVAHERVLGISKFTRIVNHFSGGLTIQERVCSNIARFFERHVSPDVMVMMEAVHTCKVARGVENPFSRTITIEARGVFLESIGPRTEFFEAIKRQ